MQDAFLLIKSASEPAFRRTAFPFLLTNPETGPYDPFRPERRIGPRGDAT